MLIRTGAGVPRQDAEGIEPENTKNVWTTLHIMWNSAVGVEVQHGELELAAQGAKLQISVYSVEEVKQLLVNSGGAERALFWLAAETGARVRVVIALRVSDANLEACSSKSAKPCGAERRTLRKRKLEIEASAFRHNWVPR